MASNPTGPVYTFRGGKKMLLGKSPDEFVVRAVDPEVNALGDLRAERLRPAGSTNAWPGAGFTAGMDAWGSGTS